MTTPTQTEHAAIANEQQYVAQTYVRPPFVLTHGEGVHVYDTDGKQYVDFVAGIAVMSLGHSDPTISEIVAKHAQQLVQVSNLYYTEPQGRLAKLLCDNSFADRVYFCNSGAEANEAAIKFARKRAYVNGDTDKTEIVTFTKAFHGRTAGALSVTPKAKYQEPFKPLLPDVTVLPYNDVAAATEHISAKTCAVIVEPLQGEGGINPADAEFLQALRKLCDKHNAVLIFDEVQCGLGRTGALWAYESSGVTPDIMTLAKPLANGLPIGATLMTDDIHSVLQPGDHGSTFAGGNLVCAVAEHVVQRVLDADLLKHVQSMGETVMAGLLHLAEKYESIVDVRGRGLMVGIEFDFPAPDVVEAGFEAGFLTVNAGPNTLRLVPPLIVEESHLLSFVSFLDTFLQNKEHASK